MEDSKTKQQTPDLKQALLFGGGGGLLGGSLAGIFYSTVQNTQMFGDSFVNFAIAMGGFALIAPMLPGILLYVFKRELIEQKQLATLGAMTVGIMLTMSG